MEKLNLVKSAEFVVSSSNYKQCPEAGLPEFAFIGRSNVGKSSLINSLIERKSLALVSGKPGKTQLINHFIINKSWYLVDLPGYGYAQASKSKKELWTKMTNVYLTNRNNLLNIFVLIDSRIPPQKIDLAFIKWVGKNQLPFSIVFTKADKPKNNTLQNTLQEFKKALLKDWEALPPIFITSARNNFGREDLLTYIQTIVTDAKLFFNG